MVVKKTYAAKLLTIFLVFVIFLTSSLTVLAADNGAVAFDGSISFFATNSNNTAVVSVFQSGVRSENGNVFASYKGNYESWFSCLFKPGYIYYGSVYQYVDVKLMSVHSGLLDSNNGYPNVSLVDSLLPDGVTARVSPISVNLSSSSVRLVVYLYFDEYIPSIKNVSFPLSFSIDSALLFDENYLSYDKEFLSYSVTRYGSTNTSGLTQNESDTLLSTGWRGKLTKQLTWIRETISDAFQTLGESISNLYNRVTWNAQNTQKVIVEGNEQQAEGNRLQEEANELQQENNDTQKGIFAKISDFFNGFFDNLSNLVLRLIVPSQDELSTFFDEVNQWFSDRLGFLWYPFDLAIRIVSLFSGQTRAGVVTGSDFKIPAITLNLLGNTYTIYSGGSVDMDAFDIFKYVRYFTSFLMVAGIIKMAIHKWDEWIGGHTG